jgi:4-amino-4-deoxy-L-arabinose transferase-like glycosyltransferase
MGALPATRQPSSWGSTNAVGSPRARLDVRAFVVRYYWLAACGVLALAAFNLTFRLGHEIVVEWDESLYGVSAWEMFQNRQWIGTTFKKALDYYNTKPPLNIWLISLSFRAFGANLISLRLPSILSAWLTVLVLQLWVRRVAGPLMALTASLVLATSFGFLYDHSARNANTDALFTLLILLTVVSLWAADRRPRQLIWLGPILAATFLLRGMGVLMPIAIASFVEARRSKPWWPRIGPLAVALVFFAAPVAIWSWQRWELDRWLFLGPLFFYDFVARSVSVIEGHRGSPLYHLNVLQKNQFVWLSAALIACGLFPVPWPRVRGWLMFWRGNDILKLAVGSWIVIAWLIPTLMRTKLSWYLNPFYPAFAMIVAWIFMQGFAGADAARASRRAALAATLVIALLASEARLLWYSVHRRSLARSTQGFLLTERDKLKGHRVFRTRWDNSELFIIDALAGAEAREAPTAEVFLKESAPGDYWLSSRELDVKQVVLVSAQRRQWLYRRSE